MKRRVAAAGSLVSLLDVLFILVFASLVQSHARGAAARAEAAAPEAPAPTPPPPVVPAPPMPLAAVRAAAAAAAAQHVAGAPLIVVRVDAAGVITELEREGDTRALRVPLIERVADEVGYAYHGDRTPALQICGVIARELRADDLAGHVVVVAPALPDAERSVILNEGLKRDLARCMRDQHAMALIVEPKAVTP